MKCALTQVCLSLQEIRVADYLANRKGPSVGGGLGTGLTLGGGLMGGTQATALGGTGGEVY